MNLDEVRIDRRTLARVGRGSVQGPSGSHLLLKPDDYFVVDPRRIEPETLVDLVSYGGTTFEALVVSDENGTTELGALIANGESEIE